MILNTNLLTDIPIQEKSEDLLEYGKFTQRLASCLKQFQSKDGLVIALNGKWGSGKTSVVNLIKADLVGETNVKIVSFSYWWYKGRAEVITAFLLGLSEAIGSLSNSEKIVSTILDFIQPLASIADHLSESQISSNVLQVVRNCCLSPISLEKKLNEIKEFLKLQKQRIIIFIDDLDRMNPDDSIEVFKLLKTIGRLPNVTFVIVYDKELANNIICQKYPSEGKNFLEKVIQVSFDMPETTSNALYSAFRSEFFKLYPDCFTKFNLRDYWQNCLQDFIKTPRNLGRLLANIQFNVSPIINDIYLLDFISLEVLRLQFPTVYHEIARNQKEICKDTALQITSNRKNERNDQFLKVLLEGVDNKYKNSLSNLLIKLLYPSISTRDAKTQRRLCSNDHFETYFNLNINQDSLSNYELQKTIAIAQDKAKFIQLFGTDEKDGTFKDKQYFAIFLKELVLHIEMIPNKKRAEELLETLISLVDKGHDANGLIRTNETTNVYQLLVYLWQELDKNLFNDPRDSEKIFLKLLKESSVNFIAQMLDEFTDSSNQFIKARPEVLHILKMSMQQKIQLMLTNNSLLSLGNRLRFCLHVYFKNFDEDSSVKEYLNWALSNSLSVDKIAKCFTSIVVTADGSEKLYAHDNEIEHYFDRDKFYETVSYVAKEGGKNAKLFVKASKYQIDSKGASLIRNFGND